MRKRLRFRLEPRPALVALLLGAAVQLPAPAAAKNLVQYFSGGGQLVCPCFASGDRIAVVFDLPASAYPLEITGVNIAWAAQFGIAGQSTEGAIQIYLGTPPAPGLPAYEIGSPVLTAGTMNEFFVDSLRVDSGPFTVALELSHSNSGMMFLPSVVHDGNGCQSGRNYVFSGGSGWRDARSLGFTGDWVFQVSYRSLVPPVLVASPGQVNLVDVPLDVTTCTTLVLSNAGADTLTIRGISGCGGLPFAIDTTLTSHRLPPGGQTTMSLCATPRTVAPNLCSVQITHDRGGSPAVIPVLCRAASRVTIVKQPENHVFRLKGVVPNPFNPETSIHFELPEAMPVTVEVWSVKGARIRTLAKDRAFPAGDASVRWDGRNGNGRPVSSGIYLIRIRTRAGDLVARAVLLE